jgi:hypothetical protein
MRISPNKKVREIKPKIVLQKIFPILKKSKNENGKRAEIKIAKLLRLPIRLKEGVLAKGKGKRKWLKIWKRKNMVAKVADNNKERKRKENSFFSKELAIRKARRKKEKIVKKLSVRSNGQPQNDAFGQREKNVEKEKRRRIKRIGK